MKTRFQVQLQLVLVVVTALLAISAGVLAWAPGSTEILGLKFFRSQAGDQTFALRPSYVNNYTLTADTITSITVPDGAEYVIFSATHDIWVEVNGTADIPDGSDVTDGTGSELNPTIRKVNPGDSIGVISQYDALMSVAFYK